MYYELATLTLPFGTAARAAAQVAEFTQSPDAGGELLGCWFTDIGRLNQMIVLRGFADLASLEAERERTRLSASPFGCGDVYLDLEQHAYKGFGWMKPVRPSAESGIEGPVYEIRTYGIKPGGVLLIASPYTWLEEHTARAHWIGGFKQDGENFTTLDGLKAALGEHFRLMRAPQDVPFVIRETRRKFQHSVAEVTLWERLA